MASYTYLEMHNTVNSSKRGHPPPTKTSFTQRGESEHFVRMNTLVGR